MKILVYIKENNGAGERLQKVIEAIVPDEQIERFRTTEDLYRRLYQPGTRPGLAVLMATNRQELSEILSFQNLLFDVRIIIILPDREEDTFALACELYPRFASYVDSDFMDISAVLRQMIQNSSQGEQEPMSRGQVSQERR